MKENWSGSHPTLAGFYDVMMLGVIFKPDSLCLVLKYSLVTLELTHC